jgi:hypothetical protein
VSPNEADFDLRENSPLPRNILHTLTNGVSRVRRWAASRRRGSEPKGVPEIGSPNVPIQRRRSAIWFYLTPVRDSAESGKGRAGNRHLNSRVESVLGNVRGPLTNAKVSSQPKWAAGVGAVIVVSGRESRPQGEGRQSVEKTGTQVTGCQPG